MNPIYRKRNQFPMKTRLHTLCVTCFIFFVLCVSLSETSYSQSIIIGNEKSRFEIGLNIGPSFFLGDLGGHAGKGQRFVKDLNLPLTKLMVGAFATYYPNEWMGVRLAAQYGKISAEDEIITTKGEDELYRKQRNLNFRSNIFETYLAGELYPLMLLHKNDADYTPRLRPYGVIGVGYLHFNPQGSLTDANGNQTWYDLRPLHTEGQGFPEYPERKEYSLSQINIPMGAGFKYYLSPRITLSIEVLLRKSFTDYIDDVSTEYIDPNLFDKYLSPHDATIARQISDKVFAIVNPGLSRNSPGTQRGNPHQNDSYFTTFFKFGIRLGPVYKNKYDQHVASMMRCPSRF
jgi:opacity protein-like surface antigen